MNSLPTEKQLFILQRFIQIKQLPTNSVASTSLKKLILLKNVYSNQRCIMKIQPKQLLESKERNILHEASFYQKFQGHIGVPLMIWSGQDFNCLVLIIQELGCSLYDRLAFNDKKNKLQRQSKMRLKDVCMIGLQMIDIVHNFHQKDYVHRNISPESFSFGLGQKITKIYVKDLLHMKKFRAKNSLNHIQCKQNSRLQFMTPFLSLNVINNKEPSRRDDIISIVYVLIYLLRGKLPWQQDWEEEILCKRQDMKQNNDRMGIDLSFSTLIDRNKTESIALKLQRRRRIQQSISSQQLFSDIPFEIKQILDMANELQYSEEPQYVRYKSLLKKILFRNKMKNDLLFQWMESQQNINRNLRIDPLIFNLSTLRQNKLEIIVYEPYEHNVNVNLYHDSLQNGQLGVKFVKDQSKQNKSQRKMEEKYKKQNYPYKKHNQCQLI